MSEPEGTAADFAAMLAGASPTSTDVSSSPAEPAPEPTKREADAAWTRALFGPEPAVSGLAVSLGLVRVGEPEHHEQPPPQDEPPPDFDGGVREPAAEPTDPIEDHNEFLTSLFRNAPPGAGGRW